MPLKSLMYFATLSTVYTRCKTIRRAQEQLVKLLRYEMNHLVWWSSCNNLRMGCDTVSVRHTSFCYKLEAWDVACMDLAADRCGVPVNDGNVKEIFKKNVTYFLLKSSSCNVMVSKLNTHHLMPVKWLIILAGWHVRIRQCQ